GDEGADAERPLGASSVFDHHRLAPAPGERIAKNPGRGVIGGAGRKGHQHAHRTLGPGQGGLDPGRGAGNDSRDTQENRRKYDAPWALWHISLPRRLAGKTKKTESSARQQLDPAVL